MRRMFAVTNDKIATTARYIVELLANGDFPELERVTNGRRLNAYQLRKAVDEYGRRLSMPPAETVQRLDVIEVTGAKPRQWSVRCDLWTEEEGCSDLSLELTLFVDDGDRLRAEVDNLHVP